MSVALNAPRMNQWPNATGRSGDQTFVAIGDCSYAPLVSAPNGRHDTSGTARAVRVEVSIVVAQQDSPTIVAAIRSPGRVLCLALHRRSRIMAFKAFRSRWPSVARGSSALGARKSPPQLAGSPLRGRSWVLLVLDILAHCLGFLYLFQSLQYKFTYYFLSIPRNCL